MNITPDQQSKLVDSGLLFLRAIGNIYGSDRAMEMWQTMADTIDPDLKGWVFSAMLTGRQGQSLVITDLPNHPNVVGIIKALRSWDRRGFGLKEAKDLYDGLAQNGRKIELEVHFEKVNNAAAEFRKLGCTGIGI